MLVLLLTLLAACDDPEACPSGAVFSAHFGQCVGVEAPETSGPTGTPESVAPTGDTGPTGG